MRAAVSERNLTLMGDSQFEQAIADIPMSDTEKAELVAINSQARVNSTITGYGVSAVVILAGLITTRWITVFKKEEEGATAAAAAPVATAGDEDLEPTPV